MARPARKSTSLKDVLEFTQFLEGVSARIHGVLDEQTIYKAIRKEFSKFKKYQATLLLRIDDGLQLVVAETSLSLTRKTGHRVRLKGRTIDLSSSVVLKRILEKQRTVDVSIQNMLEELIPDAGVRIRNKEERFTVTPIEKNREVIGAIAIRCPAVSKETVLSVKTFARHVSAALELADRYADRKRVEDELRSSREQLRNLSGYLQSVREEERSHIAREIHDELGQTITALKLDLLGLKDELSKKQKSLARKADLMVGLTDRSLQTVHKICGELRPKFLDDLGLAAALEWQAEEFSKRTGIECTVEVEPQEMAVDADLSITLFRIFQEALTNVARHAGATNVQVSLRRIDSKIAFEVSDNGKGITRGQISHPKSFGLVGMKERIRLHGGELKIKGKRGIGTDLKVTVPLEEPPLRPMVTPRMVGREKEMRRLRSLYRNAEKDKGKLILVHGEAGIGKTRLVTEFAQDLETRGTAVLIGACREDTRSIPYYPFREALNRFLDARRDEVTTAFSELPDYARWELSRILPELKTPGLPGFEPAKDHFRLFESIRLLIQGLAGQSEQPLLFTVEDIHVSDDATLDLLQYLARNLSESRVQFCATYRTEEAGESVHRFSSSLQREKLSTAVALDPLSSEDVSSMVDLLCPGSEAPERLRDLLYRKSEGNPFFVQEMTRLLPAEDTRGALAKKKTIPKSIESVLQRRLGLLDPGAREILSCGALVGEEFEFDVLQNALGRSPMEVMEAVEAGTRAYIVRESPGGKEERYRFIHSLMSDVLYSGIGKARRKLWHSKVGDALEKHYADRLTVLNGRLTYHFELGENWEKAFNYALASAKHAKDTYANEEAVFNYRRALKAFGELTTESQAHFLKQELTIREELGNALIRTGRFDDAIECFNRMEVTAKNNRDRIAEVGALLGVSHVLWQRGIPVEAMTYLKRALALSKEVSHRRGVAESLQLIGDCQQMRGQSEEALKCLRKSLLAARAIGDKGLVAMSLKSIGVLSRELGSYDAALQHLEESLRTAREAGHAAVAAGCLLDIGWLFHVKGLSDQALGYCEQALVGFLDVGEMHNASIALMNTGTVHLASGSDEKALACFRKALTTFTAAGDLRNASVCLNNMGIVHRRQGSYAAALKCYHESLTMSREVDDKSGAAATLSNIGNIHRDRGRNEEAMRCYRKSLDLARDAGDRRTTVFALTYMGGVCEDRCLFDESLRHLGDALTIAQSMGAKRRIAVVLSMLGAVKETKASYEEALACLDRALAIFRHIGGHAPQSTDALRLRGRLKRIMGQTREAIAVHESALKMMPERGPSRGLLLVELGRDFLSSGDPDGAQTPLSEALAIGEELDHPVIRLSALAALSESHLATGDTVKAHEEAARAAMLVESTDNVLLAVSVHLTQATVLSPSPEALPLARKALRSYERIGCPDGVWRAHRVVAQCLCKKGDKASARRHYRKAKETVGELASMIQKTKMRKSYLNRKDIKEMFAELAELEGKKPRKAES